MKNLFRTTSQDPNREAPAIDTQTAQRLRVIEARFVNERGICSPRGCVAFSALSACVWLREKLDGLAKRITMDRTSTPTRILGGWRADGK
jgi:hypothetical protein